MTGSHPRLPGSGLVWGLVVFVFVTMIGAAGLAYAELDGRRRTVALTCLVALEVIVVIATGLYLRRRIR